MAARSREAAQPRARSDAYVGMLALAFIAQLVGALFLYLDYSSYPPGTPPKVASAPPAASAPAPSAPAQVPAQPAVPQQKQ